MLLFCVPLVILVFKNSNNLTQTYGLAVSGTMAITGFSIIWIFLLRGYIVKTLFAVFLFGVNMVFLLANLHKIPYGGYWSLVIAFVPLCIILVYVCAQEKLSNAVSSIPLDEFLPKFNKTFNIVNRISGMALSFARDFRRIPQYIPRIMFTNNIVYDDNIIVSIIRTEQPFDVTWSVTREITRSLSIFEIYLGYMEIAEIGKILKDADIDEKTIFDGMEDIITTSPVWRSFAFIKRVSPSVVQFYKHSSDKIHGVVIRVEM